MVHLNWYYSSTSYLDYEAGGGKRLVDLVNVFIMCLNNMCPVVTVPKIHCAKRAVPKSPCAKKTVCQNDTVPKVECAKLPGYRLLYTI